MTKSFKINYVNSYACQVSLISSSYFLRYLHLKWCHFFGTPCIFAYKLNTNVLASMFRDHFMQPVNSFAGLPISNISIGV